jgi:hypothetical protein
VRRRVVGRTKVYPAYHSRQFTLPRATAWYVLKRTVLAFALLVLPWQAKALSLSGDHGRIEMLRKFFFVVITLFATSSFAADEVTKLTARDLAVETSKWKGKKIETVMSCFYADVEDYRCVGGTGSRVDFSIISNEEGKQHLEKNCDTIGKISKDICTVRIRFVYEDFERRERANSNFTLISAEDQKGEVFPVDRKRRYKMDKTTLDTVSFKRTKK